MLQWIKYFLVGIDQTASEGVLKLSSILQLKEDAENMIKNNFGRRSSKGLILLHSLFRNPAVNVDQVAKICTCSYKAANDLVNDFRNHQLLKEITGQSRNRFFIFEPFIRIF